MTSDELRDKAASYYAMALYAQVIVERGDMGCLTIHETKELERIADTIANTDSTKRMINDMIVFKGT